MRSRRETGSERVSERSTRARRRIRPRSGERGGCVARLKRGGGEETRSASSQPVSGTTVSVVAQNSDRFSARSSARESRRAPAPGRERERERRQPRLSRPVEERRDTTRTTALVDF